MNWLAGHSLPRHIRYFSLGTIVHRADTARLMYLSKRLLDRTEPLNDGQVPYYHQLIPGSTLLGYANADHWAVALPLQSRWPYWAGNRSGRRFPRTALFEAIVLYLIEALGQQDDRLSPALLDGR